MANKSYKHGIDFGGSNKIEGLQQASSAGDAVEYSQNVADLATKQDNISGGPGISKDGTSISVDLQTAGTDYDVLSLSGTFYSSLDGDYVRANYRADLDYVGTDLDLNFGGDWNVYYKDNGSGVWAVVMKRDTDQTQSTTPESGTWLAVLTTIDPTTITASVDSFIPNYQAVPHDFVTYASEQDETGLGYSPSSSDSQVSYAAGADPAGLKFTNSKLGLDFAGNVSSAASTKVFPSSVVKTYIDEQITEAKDLSNHPFNNAIANISGNPSNAQSMGEKLAAEIDTLDGQVSALQTKDSVHDSFIADNTSALGISQGDDAFPPATGAALPFVGNTLDASSRFQKIGESIGDVYSNIGGLLGLGQFDSDFGGGFVILPNGGNAKSLFQSVELELQSLSAGAGATWLAGVVKSVETSNISNLSNPSTDVFGGETLSQGDVFLAAGQTAQSENGFYVFDTTSTGLERWEEADTSEAFIQNRSVQIVSDGTEWAYKGIADPTVDTNVLPFEKIRESIIADQAISEAKLDSALSTKINAKADRFEQTGITLIAGVAFQVDHNLGIGVPMYGVYDSLNNEIGIEFDIVDNNSITIKSSEALTNVKIAIM